MIVKLIQETLCNKNSIVIKPIPFVLVVCILSSMMFPQAALAVAFSDVFKAGIDSSKDLDMYTNVSSMPERVADFAIYDGFKPSKIGLSLYTAGIPNKIIQLLLDIGVVAGPRAMLGNPSKKKLNQGLENKILIALSTPISVKTVEGLAEFIVANRERIPGIKVVELSWAQEVLRRNTELSQARLKDYQQIKDFIDPTRTVAKGASPVTPAQRSARINDGVKKGIITVSGDAISIAPYKELEFGGLNGSEFTKFLNETFEISLRQLLLLKEVSEFKTFKMIPLNPALRPWLVLDRNWSGSSSIMLEKWQPGIASPGALLNVFAPFCLMRWVFTYSDLPDQSFVVSVFEYLGKFNQNPLHKRAIVCQSFSRCSKSFLGDGFKLVSLINCCIWSGVYEVGTRGEVPSAGKVLTLFEASWSSNNLDFDKVWTDKQFSNLALDSNSSFILDDSIKSQSPTFIANLCFYLVLMLSGATKSPLSLKQITSDPNLIYDALGSGDSSSSLSATPQI